MNSCQYTVNGNNEVIILLSNQIYDKEAILSAAYSLISEYKVSLSEIESVYKLVIASSECLPINAERVGLFLNDCIDHQLRLVLDKKTSFIRDLIVKHAFEPLDLKNEVEHLNAQ